MPVNRIPGIFVALAGFGLIAFSDRLARWNVRAMHFTLSERGQWLTRGFMAAWGAAFAYGGARLFLGLDSVGGAPYPDGSANRAADYFAGTLMTLMGVGAFTFRRPLVRLMAEWTRDYLVMTGGRARFHRTSLIVVGSLWLALGVALAAGLGSGA